MGLSASVRGLLRGVDARVSLVFLLFIAWKGVELYAGDGGLIDWATMYQSAEGILRGAWLGPTIIPGIPLLAEHAALTQYLTTPLNLLPPTPAYLAWWGAYAAAIALTGRRALRGWGWALLLLSPPILLTPPPENYLWTALAPLAAVMLLRGDKAGWIPAVIAAAGIEYVGGALLVLTSLAAFAAAWLRGEAGDEWVTRVAAVSGFGAAWIAIDAAWLHAARAAAGIHAGLFSTIVGSPLSGGYSIQPDLLLLGLLDALITAPLIPALIDLRGAAPTLAALTPFLLAAPIYLTPFVYYLAPLTATALAFTPGVGRLWRGGWSWRATRLWALMVLAAIISAAVASMASAAAGSGVVYIPFDTPLAALPPIHVSGVVVTNGFACGYVVMNCTVWSSPVVLGAAAGGGHALATMLPGSLTNPTLAVNPPTHNPATFIYVEWAGGGGNESLLAVVSPSIGGNVTLTAHAAFINMLSRLVIDAGGGAVIGAVIGAAVALLSTKRGSRHAGERDD